MTCDHSANMFIIFCHYTYLHVKCNKPFSTEEAWESECKYLEVRYMHLIATIFSNPRLEREDKEGHSVG